ncbi:MAG: hypothetical protein J0M13_18790 [Candidatus Accumulibacter sp.]|jgi:hypothetical protein|nr:hypothetical protein [Candidatus Accumulibacter necessarius]
MGDYREQRDFLPAVLGSGRGEGAPNFPFNTPRAYRPPAWSRKLTICEGMRPQRVG